MRLAGVFWWRCLGRVGKGCIGLYWYWHSVCLLHNICVGRGVLAGALQVICLVLVIISIVDMLGEILRWTLLCVLRFIYVSTTRCSSFFYPLQFLAIVHQLFVQLLFNNKYLRLLSIKPLWHLMIATSVIMYSQNYIFNKGK